MDNEMLSLKNNLKESIQKFIEKGFINEASELLKIYENINGLDLETYSIKAIIKMLQNKFDEADEILKKAIELYPNDSTLMFNMAYLKDKQNKYIEAIEYYCLGKLVNPNSKVIARDIITEIKEIDYANLKVIHGTIEIANQMHTITEGLKKIGINAKTLNYYPNYLEYKQDEEFDITKFSDLNKANIETKKVAAKKIATNDIFHFHFGTSLTLDHTDLALINELGKKIVMQHWGSDVRQQTKAKKNSPNVKVKVLDENSIKNELEQFSKLIKNCIVSDYELYEYVKEHYENVYVIPPCINLNKFKNLNYKKNRDKLLVVHAPTDREVKGTEYIINAVYDLKNIYDLDFILIENLRNEEALEIYKEADIVIDQLLIGSYGLVAIESMAMGKTVISYINDYMKTKYPIDLPIISANIDNIKFKLESLIKKKEQLNEIGEKGRVYVEKYHDINCVSKKIEDIYRKI